MDSKYTIEQEGWIEEKYEEFFAAISQAKITEAAKVINEVGAKEFFSVAEDMTKILASKKLHHAV